MKFVRRIADFASKTAIVALKFYKRFVSPCLPPVCRFEPTCSTYMREAIEKKGLAKGAFLGVRRLLKCHPFHEGGFDPVP